MKKFLSAILCVAMLFSLMSFTALADVYTPAARSLDIYASSSSVKAGDTVDITVKINGYDITNVEWDLEWNPALFELQTIKDYDGTSNSVTNTTGYLTKEHHILTDKTGFPYSATVKTYTFVALAQDNEMTGAFSIKNQISYTDYESMKPIDTTTDTNGSVEVTIELIEYDINVIIDGVETTETSFNIPYDDKERTFVVTTDPAAADITYEVNGTAQSEVKIKDKGTYTITYTITPEKGYKPESVEFVFTVEEPVFEVEVTENYVEGKTLVLVYTDVDNVWFKYDSNIMVDVSVGNYIFNDGSYDHKNVYGFVVDGIDGGSLQDYRTHISDVYESTGLKTVTAYNEDINESGGAPEIRDLRSVYIVMNSIPEYFVGDDFMIQILKSDIDNSRCVDGTDANIVKEAVYPTQTI